MDVVEDALKDAELLRLSPIREDSVQAVSVRSLELVAHVTMLPSVMSAPAEEEFLLGRLRDGRLRVVVPIPVRTVREGASFVAEATSLNEFGFGKNQSEAIADLQHAIAELYFSLKADQHRLGPDLVKVWKTLHSLVVERLTP